MRVLISLLFICAAWFWGDLRNWKRHYPTIQYMLMNQLLYRFFVDRYHYLWKIEHDLILLNATFSFLVDTFLIYPFVVILFLSNFPKTGWGRKVFYCVFWIVLFSSIEKVMDLLGLITYHNGWNFWWSVGFDVALFPMLQLHSKRPLLTWGISFLIIIFYLVYFHVPIH